MIELLVENPWLISDFQVQTQVGKLPAELRLKRVGEVSNVAGCEVIAFRVVESFDWDSEQNLYFEATEGSLSLEEVDAQDALLTGAVSGFYRPRVRPNQLQGEADFRTPPVHPATLRISLTLRSAPPGSKAPFTDGSLSITSTAFAGDLGVDQIDGTIVSGEARFFPHDLPAVDASGEILGSYYINIVPLLIQGGGSPGSVFDSPGVLVPNAVDIWRQCGICVIPSDTAISLTPGADVISQLVNDGITDLLLDFIRGQIKPGNGVPVAFVQPLFAQGGGRTSDHGPQRAIVVVAEAGTGDPPLLAHELGHVLGGKEAGSQPDSTYWVGESNTLMQGSGSVSVPGPTELGAVATEKAPPFALYKKTPVDFKLVEEGTCESLVL